MFNIRIDGLVGTIVNQMLVGKGREKEGLYLNFDLRMSHHIGSKSYDQSRGLHLIYQLNPGMSYVNVFSGVTDSPFGKMKEVAEWEHESSHDSCWRDVRIFSSLYFDMATKINTMIVADGELPVAPKDIHEWHNMRWLYQWVPVVVKKDPSDTNNYRRIIELP